MALDEPVPDVDELNARTIRFQYLDTSVRLYQAALKGDWEDAEALFEKYSDVFRRPITEENQTVLHIAVAAERPAFVKELVKRMSSDEMALPSKNGNTALCFAAVSGIVLIAKEMVEVNKKLPLIRGIGRKTPLYMAALNGRREMVSYLYPLTPFEDLQPKERIEILVATISTDMYGFKGMSNKALMQMLAHELVKLLWSEVLLLPKDQFSNLVENHSTLLFEAAELGNVDYLIILIRTYPDLIWRVDKKKRSIFHIAVKFRQENVFNLIYEIGSIKGMIAQEIDTDDNTMLHLAGRLAPLERLNIISGAALQMQRELLWFKEIEKIVPPSYKKLINKEIEDEPAETPWESFTKNHEKLKEQGEKWMKDTANYCMLVAALIATVVFAAAFTVPGGNNQEIGIPIFLKRKWFLVFFISDAIALVSSATSILIFLSILTSRYAEEDFLESLPASEMAWLPIVIIVSAGVPVTLFVMEEKGTFLESSCIKGQNWEKPEGHVECLLKKAIAYIPRRSKFLVEEPAVIEIVEDDGKAMLIPEEAKSESPEACRAEPNPSQLQPKDTETAREPEGIPHQCEVGSHSQELPCENEVNP
ncbi:ankyrin repeat-containing protein At5g02620-like [Corylus avellana]|uniref:ankyrin repeat-containing protein At5g02620-like n=1 Tax=Corylus avellana TaxID=13451 RepID=UPI00286CE8D6|nr:ankyrin repeat-containing protein At5g02620-like [Corylus avellana]